MSADPTPAEGIDVPPAEPTPIRSSEGRIILESVRKLGTEVAEIHEGQGKMMAELARTQLEMGGLRAQVQRLEDTLNRRMDSMRPKVAKAVEDSERISEVPEIIEQKLDQRDLVRFRTRDQESKVLRLEAYKVILGVVLAGALGVGSTIAWQAVLFAAAHQSAKLHTAGP